jgi:beta-galactosidase
VTIPVQQVAAIPYVEPGRRAADLRAQLAHRAGWRCASGPEPETGQLRHEHLGLGFAADARRGGKYHLYRASFTPRKNLSDGTGRIRFAAIKGKAEIWLNGQLIGKKDSYARRRWT